MSTASVVSAEDLRYPIGKYQAPASIGRGEREAWINDMELLPAKLRQAVEGLSDTQLDTPYRPGGWTVRQVVHHVPDSHLNSYTRFRLALTEDAPTIKSYEESAWAELPDAKTGPIAISLDLLEALHGRFVMLLRSMDADGFGRVFQHPEWGKIRLDWTLGLYAWHSRHHVAHITGLRRREGW